MTCVDVRATFRLLDALVGWDEASAEGVAGLAGPGGVTLARLDGSGAKDRILGRFLPPRLARGCGPCEWLLVTPTPPRARVLRLDACGDGFAPLWPRGCRPRLEAPSAIAARRHDFAIADGGLARILVWADTGTRQIGSIPAPAVTALALDASGRILVAANGTGFVAVLSPNGDPIARIEVPAEGTIERIAVAGDCSTWIAVRSANGWTVHRCAFGSPAFEPATVDELEAALPPFGVSSSATGFCLEEGPARRCFSWWGRPVEPTGAPAPAALAARGQIVTRAIDSGITGCTWHRVRVDADVPPGTGVAVALATSDVPDPPDQGVAGTDPDWAGFEPGPPHPADWHELPRGALDGLVDQPPGRYAFVRVRLTGSGAASPVLRRIRLDFPRSTSLAHLPSVYHHPPEAEDFTERFLSLFDASIERLDRTIERYPALLDVDGVPSAVLPWLGSMLDVALDPEWDAATARRVLRAAPELYRRRGTPSGLADAVELVVGVRPVVREEAQTRAWGALGRTAALRSMRLFGRSSARLRLGASKLSSAPLRSHGDPDLDPLTVGAHRFQVLVPAASLPSRDVERLRALVDGQAPAHALGSVRVGGSGFVVGMWGSVGVDTVLSSLPAPRLGGRGAAGNVRLGRMSVLWNGQSRTYGPRVGETTAVGVSTVSR